MLQDGEKGVILQRDKETYAIAPHIFAGVTDAHTLRKIADVAEKYQAALKITSAQRIAIIGLKEDDIDNAWKDLDMPQGHPIGLCVRSIKACPGTTYCKKGKLDSLHMAKLLEDKYNGMPLPGKLKFGVSGCPNQCAENCIKDIGLYATGKGWQLTVGGNGGGSPRLAQLIAKDLSDEQALVIFDKVIEFYKKHAKPHHRLGKTLESVNFDDFVREVTSDII